VNSCMTFVNFLDLEGALHVIVQLHSSAISTVAYSVRHLQI
jgi:hypothetical protein